MKQVARASFESLPVGILVDHGPLRFVSVVALNFSTCRTGPEEVPTSRLVFNLPLVDVDRTNLEEVEAVIKDVIGQIPSVPYGGWTVSEGLFQEVRPWTSLSRSVECNSGSMSTYGELGSRMPSGLNRA